MELIYVKRVWCQETAATELVTVPRNGGTVEPVRVPGYAISVMTEQDVAALLRGDKVTHKGDHYYI